MMATSLSLLARRAALAATRKPYSVVFRALTTQVKETVSPAGNAAAGSLLKEDREVCDNAKMETKMAEMNQSIEAMKTNYAVDAPDGESDGHIEEELEEVKHIMDETGKPRKKPPVMQGNATRNMETQMAEMNQSIKAMKTNYAVDAPDGESDGHIEEELEEVKHIIDETGKPRKKPPKDDESADPFGMHIH